MNKFLIAISALTVLGGVAATPAQASPQQDLEQFRDFFYKKFPGVKLQDYGNGIYALDAARRFEWQEMEEFPPYEEGLETGEKLFMKYGIAKCFPNGGVGIKQNYPYFDTKSGKVRTLEQDINACVVKNGHKKLKWKKGELPAIGAYMAYTSRGKAQKVVIPNNKAALAAYEDGKTTFYAKRGQLNFACADCHVYNSGMMARGNLLSAGLGQTSHFPVWRRKWAGGKGGTAGFGTLQRRYGGCNKQVRAAELKAQSEAYNNLEYFHTYMSNGIKLNGPAVRQ